MFRPPRAHRKRMKSTNMLERLNQKIKRLTKVVRVFPNQASCLRLIRALLAETHDEWVTGYRYLEGTPKVLKDSLPESERLKAIGRAIKPFQSLLNKLLGLTHISRMAFLKTQI